MHTQNSRLRRVDDRRREHRAENAAVGNRESAAGHFVDTQFAIAGAGSQANDLLLDARKRQFLRVTDHGHYQSSGRRYGDGNIAVIVIDNVVAIHVSIYDRKILQSRANGFGKEGHETQTNFVLFLEFLLVLRS